MGATLRVDYAALDACVDQHLQAADLATDINAERQSARLPEGSLGKLPQSAEIQAAFDQAYSDAGQSLRDVARALRSTSERVGMTRSELAELDSYVAELFTKMGGE
jgi:hypothetical protein